MKNQEANLACVHTPGNHPPKDDQRCLKCKHGPWSRAREVWREFCEDRQNRNHTMQILQQNGIQLLPRPRWRRAGL